MKNRILEFLALTIFSTVMWYPNIALGQRIGSQAQYDRVQNKLVNPGFESGKAKWTNTGSGAFTLVTSGSNLFNGSTSASWDAAASGNLLTSALVPLTAGNQLYTATGSCRAAVMYKGGNANITLEVTDSVGNVKEAHPFTASAGAWVYFGYSFPCSDIGDTQAAIQLQDNTGNPPAIFVDDFFLGVDQYATQELTETFLNKTLFQPVIDTATLVSGSSHMIVASSGNTSTRTVTIATGDADRSLTFGGTLSTGGAFTTSGSSALTLTTTGSTNVTLPTTGTLATLAGTESLTNKTLDNTTTLSIKDTLLTLQDDADTSKRFKFDVTNVSPSTTRTYGVPNADTTLVGTNVSQALTNKTLDSTNTITGATAGNFTNTGTITLPTATTTLVGRATTDTLSNKTLDNTNTTAAKDTLFTLQDDGDATKLGAFQLSAVTTGTTRTITWPNFNMTLPAADGSNGQAMTTNGLGVLTFSSVVTNPMTTAGDIIYGGVAGAPTRLAIGSATQTLHGGASAPSYSAVVLTTDVSGILPTANGGTAQNSTATFPTSGVVVTEAATETLTNKTLTTPVISSITNTGTITLPTTTGTLALNVGTTTGDIAYCSTTATPCVLSRLAGAAGVLHSAATTAPSYSTIVDADVNAAAAIAGSKLASPTITTTGPVVDGTIRYNNGGANTLTFANCSAGPATYDMRFSRTGRNVCASINFSSCTIQNGPAAFVTSAIDSNYRPSNTTYGIVSVLGGAGGAAAATIATTGVISLWKDTNGGSFANGNTVNSSGVYLTLCWTVD